MSAKIDYACLAMLELAIRYEAQQPVQIKKISENHSIPFRFLVQILLQLKNAGLVQSTRGVSGGYQLAKAPQEISLANIVNVFEVNGPDRSENHGDNISPMANVIQKTWLKINEVQSKILEQTTLAKLVEQVKDRPHSMYYI